MLTDCRLIDRMTDWLHVLSSLIFPSFQTPVEEMAANSNAANNLPVSSGSGQDRVGVSRPLPDLLGEEAPTVGAMQTVNAYHAVPHRHRVSLLSRSFFVSYVFRRDFQTIREDLLTKLRKIDALIGNAAEIQTRYQSVSDPASQKCTFRTFLLLNCRFWIKISSFNRPMWFHIFSNSWHVGEAANSKTESGEWAQPISGKIPVFATRCVSDFRTSFAAVSRVCVIYG